MRKLDNTNFEQSNIEYIQFWMLDPFMDSSLDNREGGSLYFNLGEISEDILKDGFPEDALYLALAFQGLCQVFCRGADGLGLLLQVFDRLVKLGHEFEFLVFFIVYELEYLAVLYRTGYVFVVFIK